MIDFKAILHCAAKPNTRQLVIFPDVDSRESGTIKLFNEAGDAGMCPIMRTIGRTMVFDDSFVILRAAHGNLQYELKGHTLHAIHGLDNLDRLENADGVKLALMERITHVL